MRDWSYIALYLLTPKIEVIGLVERLAIILLAEIWKDCVAVKSNEKLAGTFYS